jgi:hypothetical protein
MMIHVKDQAPMDEIDVRFLMFTTSTNTIPSDYLSIHISEDELLQVLLRQLEKVNTHLLRSIYC